MIIIIVINVTNIYSCLFVFRNREQQTRRILIRYNTQDRQNIEERNREKQNKNKKEIHEAKQLCIREGLVTNNNNMN